MTVLPDGRTRTARARTLRHHSEETRTERQSVPVQAHYGIYRIEVWPDLFGRALLARQKRRRGYQDRAA
jgi:hypothetical protein